MTKPLFDIIAQLEARHPEGCFDLRELNQDLEKVLLNSWLETLHTHGRYMREPEYHHAVDVMVNTLANAIRYGRNHPLVGLVRDVRSWEETLERMPCPLDALGDPLG